MTKLEEYTGKAEASLAAAAAATNERDRAFHRRAHTIFRRLILGLDEAEKRAAMIPVPKSGRSASTSLGRDFGRKG